MVKRSIIVIIAGLLLAVLAGCGDPASALPASPSPVPILARLPTVTPATPSSTSFPTFTPRPTATPQLPRGIATARVNVRSGPGLDFSVSTVVAANDPVDLLGYFSGWYNVVAPDGTVGWISEAILDVAPEVATVIPAVTPTIAP